MSIIRQDDSSRDFADRLSAKDSRPVCSLSKLKNGVDKKAWEKGGASHSPEYLLPHQQLNYITMKDKCLVCEKAIRKGDRAGFAPLHAGQCADKWNSYSEKKRKELLTKKEEK